MPDPLNEFEVSAQRRNGACVVRVSGELDISTHERLGEQLSKVANGKLPIVVDLSSCDFIDSSGIRALLLGVKAVEANSKGTGAFSIASPGPQVRRILEMTGVDRTVPVHGSVDEALKKL